MRAPSLDLRLLEVFEAVFVEKSLTNAALKLSMTQPAVSQGLAKLRGHFGDPLFVRTIAGMEPTPRAREVFVTVSNILREAREGLTGRPTFEAQSSEREFTIATTDLGAGVLLPGLIGAVRERAPKVRIVNVSSDMQDLSSALAGGDCALAIGNFPHLQVGIHAQGLYEESYVLLAGRAFADEAPLTLERFCAARHVLVSAGQSGHFHAEVEKQLRTLLSPDHIVATAPSFLAAPLLMRESDLLLVVPRRVAMIFAAPLGLEPLPLPIELPAYPITQYWHTRYHQDPGVVWLRRLVSELFSKSEHMFQPMSAAMQTETPA